MKSNYENEAHNKTNYKKRQLNASDLKMVEGIATTTAAVDDCVSSFIVVVVVMLMAMCKEHIYVEALNGSHVNGRHRRTRQLTSGVNRQ